MPRPADPTGSPSLGSLERTLERTVERLVGSPQSREARALLIEARRLRSVVANWRSLPPPADVLDEMVDRVLQLSTAVGIAPSEEAGPADESSPDPGEYSLDFEPHLYTLETDPALRPAIAPPAPRPRGEAAAAMAKATAARSDANVMARVAAAKSRLSEPTPPAHRGHAVPLSPPPAPGDEPGFTIPRHPAPFEATRVSPAPPLRASSAPFPSAPAALFSGPTPPPRPLSVPPADTRELGVPRTRVDVQAVTLGDPRHPSLVFLNAHYSPRADAYRALRRKLAAGTNPHVMGVTSAHAGEGKTTCAINFALALCEGARGKVLLIEANHRAPSFAEVFGFSPPRCFLLQLKEHLADPRSGWIAAEPMPKLHVLAIDPKLEHEPLLDPVAFGAGMERLAQAGYDFIVIDSPPVLGSVDCNVISDSVEGMILACLTMKSKRKEMRKAVEQLLPAPVLGVVVLDA